jgi:hypothetical protein
MIVVPCPKCSGVHAPDACPIVRGARHVELTGERRAEPPRRTPLHEHLPPCPVCGVKARESCIDLQGRPMPGTAVHRARVARPERA